MGVMSRRVRWFALIALWIVLTAVFAAMMLTGASLATLGIVAGVGLVDKAVIELHGCNPLLEISRRSSELHPVVHFQRVSELHTRHIQTVPVVDDSADGTCFGHLDPLSPSEFPAL